MFENSQGRRRSGFGIAAVLAATASAACAQERPRFAQPKDHYATGKNGAVAATTRETAEAALWALAQGGNAADAYITAALTQTVVEHGLTSLGGGFSILYFENATGAIHSVLGPLGPAAAEPYDYDRDAPATQTGRAMPVPGFVAGVHAAHQQFGKLPWKKLFEPAVKHAREGFTIGSLLADVGRSKAARFEEGKALWMTKGRFLRPGDKLVQEQLGATLQRIAEEGPEYFYTGAFARNYVRRAQADGGRLTLEDMAGWRQASRSRKVVPEGNYRGHRIVGGGLNIYALHLNEALDLKGSGPGQTNAETVFRQYRIMEEVFHSSREYTKETHDRFTSPEHARERAEAVSKGPLRKMSFDMLFNTCFLVVRDRDGNLAWGTHSINTPQSFGAGILVDGVYAAYAMNRAHVRGTGASAPGLSTSLALFKEGKPRLIAGSPGFGFVHGPWQYCTGIVEWGLSPAEAMNQPRFGLPVRSGGAYFESHYRRDVFEVLKKRGIPIRQGRPSPFTGLVGALTIDADGTLHVVQDGRVDGYARAE